MVRAATSASSASTSGILGSDTSGADNTQWWTRFAPANDRSAAGLKTEVEGLRADLRAALSAIAGNTKKTATILDDVSRGEQTINTVAA